MTYFHGIGVAIAAALAFWAPAGAETLPRPTVEYRADLRVESGVVVLSGPVHYTPDKERRALAIHSTQIPRRPIIIRRDKGVIWVLNPERKSYIRVPLSRGPGPAGSLRSRVLTEKTVVGRDTIDGMETTKYKVTFARDKRTGTQLAGHMWLSKDGIVVRVLGETRSKNRARPFRHTLTNLEIGPQPAVLFEVPAGFVQVAPSHPTKGIIAITPRRER